jgi:hypothetical protein
MGIWGGCNRVNVEGDRKIWGGIKEIGKRLRVGIRREGRKRGRFVVGGREGGRRRRMFNR